MHTIFLHIADYGTPKDLHEALKLLLGLPEYYGSNADALHDCLSERRETINMTIFGQPNSTVEPALKHCMAVIRDLGGKVIHI